MSVITLGPGETDTNIVYIVPLPSYIPQGTYYVGFYADYYSEVTESDENNGFYMPTPLTVTNGIRYSLHLPYPMIFIHGLNSNNKTWDSLSSWLTGYGWSRGGVMNFCLNEDGDLSTGELRGDYIDFTETATLQTGDFYTVNFDVNADGTTYNNSVESNQSAAVKQGWAMRDAVRHVLEITHADNVILVGHSMGGLAAREYLQDEAKWQADGSHHVAKLLTLGTPHGGSNQWTFGLIDGYSEAVRDLRWSYSNGANGVYLFGETENGISSIGFHNVDVNCNGIIGDNIVGLNQKSITSSLVLMYTCIIGTGGLSGDGVVDASRANLNNYYNFSLPADTFLVSTTHTNLPKELYTAMKGLDEPTYFTQAYQIYFDSLYFGLITEQSKGSPLYPDTTDYDDYSFSTETPGSLRLTIQDVPIHQLKIEVFDSLYNSKFAAWSGSQAELDTTVQLNAGRYFFEVSGVADRYSWEFPYAFKLGFSATTSVDEGQRNRTPSEFTLYQNFPNPFNSTATIEYDISHETWVMVNVYNILGQEVVRLVNERQSAGKYTVRFDASQLPTGVYIYELEVEGHREAKRMILMR